MVIHGVSFRMDGVEVSWSDTSVSLLAPGQSVTLSANGGPRSARWTAKAGSQTVVAVVDPMNRIPNESNESNNSLKKALQVGTARAGVA